MARERYTAQVALLVRALPVIADEPSFAVKGGTAINLFYRDMLRSLSTSTLLTCRSMIAPRLSRPSTRPSTAWSNERGGF